MVRQVPVSCWMNSCVLRAMRAEKSVGSAIASSSALVCSDCVWPCVAASASMQVRVTLLNTSCAVRLQPEVWQCVRSAQRLGVLRGELALDELRPEQARGAHLGDLHEEVHADRPEERQPRRERVDVEAGRDAGAHVFDAVGQRVGELEVGRRAGFLHVIAGDRDGVELRHLLRRVGEDVGDDAHRGIGRIDVGVAHHELFEDVVLNGARQLGRRHALLLARDDEQRQDRQHRAVHGHRHAHLRRGRCRRTACACRGWNRSRRRPCRRRRARAGGRCRSRGGWPDRRRSTGPSGRRRCCAGRRRWSPRRWRNPRTGGWSTAA